VSLTRLPLVPVAFVTALPFGPLGEEFGWRGYALPRMLAERGALTSAVIIGLIWTMWHVPLFWAPLGTTISGSRVTWRAVGLYVVEIVSASIILTWLYVGTGGSLWIAVAFHAALNAEMHRFVFEPFSDETSSRVTRATLAILATVALVLSAWPGLSWRG